MAHRSKKPANLGMSPVKKTIIGAVALGIGIIVTIVIGACSAKSLVKNLPWKV